MNFKQAIGLASIIAFVTAFFWVAHMFTLGLFGNFAQIVLVAYISKFGVTPPKSRKDILAGKDIKWREPK